MKARAAVAIKPWSVALREVDVPEPGPDDVVVRVTHSWISNGTEGSFVRGERIAGDTPRSAADPLPFPHVSGYQKVGIVDSVGASVTDLQVGERVFATVSAISGMFYGFAGHVSPAVTHRGQIWKLPAGLDPVAASGLVLTQVGYNMGICPTLSPGDAVIVLGDGMVGHWAAQTYAWRGARVLMVGRHDERLALFTQGETVNARHADVLEAVRSFAPHGLQVIADSVGDVPLVEALTTFCRHQSHVVSAGFHGNAGRIDIQILRQREMKLHAPAGWAPDRMDATLALIASGDLQTLPLITHRFPVERADEAFDLILLRREPVLGVILEWE